MGPQEAKVEGVNVTATGDGQRMAEALRRWGHASSTATSRLAPKSASLLPPLRR